MFLFDSSTIIELHKGEDEKLLEKYKDISLVTIALAYGEVYLYYLRKALNKNKLKDSLEIVEFTLEDVEDAMELLFERKKTTKDFSFVDAVIYAVAKNNNLILVTKDLGFKGLPNVELIAS